MGKTNSFIMFETSLTRLTHLKKVFNCINRIIKNNEKQIEKNTQRKCLLNK